MIDTSKLALRKEWIQILLNGRDYLKEELSKLSFVEKIYPTDANFLLVKVDDANKRYAELIAKGIVIRNRTMQPLCDNCLRLTVGTELENRKLMAVLKQL